MNRERFPELKTRAEECLNGKTAREAELQQAIRDASLLVSANAVRRDEAQACGDAQAYQEARNLADMHTDRMHKAQDELRSIMAGAGLPGDLYKEISDFIAQDSNTDVIECMRKIRDLLDNALQLVKECDERHAEYASLAAYCGNANSASTTGTYKNISVGAFNRHVYGELQRLRGSVNTLSQ